MNNCREWNDNLLNLALGGAAPADARAVEAHLANCADCAAALKELRARAEKIDAALRELVHEAEPSPGFRTRVLASIETGARPTAPRTRRWALAGGLAVTALLVAAAFLLVPRGKWLTSGPRPTGRPLTSLSAWRSPTEALLHNSGEEALQSAPRLGSFYFSLMPAPDSRRKD